MSVVIAVDCGSHAVRSVAVDVDSGAVTHCAAEDIELSFPRPGWVEVEPDPLAEAAIRVLRTATQWAQSGGHRVVALGITNMRETAFAWRRSDGQALCPAVMWMSQQSAPIVADWIDRGLEPLVRQRTGLTLDPFFFGTKIAWLLGANAAVAAAATAGDLAIGTVDAWLVHRLTGGRQHRTDPSNGSRTLVMDLATRAWDPLLCQTLGIPLASLPEVTRTMGDFGVTDAAVCGVEIPITGVIADQQGSLLGHGCEEVGGAKVTFGTSGVVCLNTGTETPLRDGLVTSVGWVDEAGRPRYEIEGSAFHSGYTVSWLAERTGHPLAWDLPLEPPDRPADQRIYVLPAFSVLGAPRWPKRSGAAITGLLMESTTTDIMRAGVEAMAFQAYDLFAAMGDTVGATAEVNVDGGGARNDYLCQLLADLFGCDIVRPQSQELTAIGAAKAALRGAGIPADPFLGQDRSVATRFRPRADATYARDGYDRWVELVETVLR